MSRVQMCEWASMIGATGVLTLEGWALGKPVVVNLRRAEPAQRSADATDQLVAEYENLRSSYKKLEDENKELKEKLEKRKTNIGFNNP